MSERDPHLRLAGVTRLSVQGGRGPSDVFLFDPHRLALPSWHVALEGKPAALLVTFDRHFDLVVPERPASMPDRSAGLRAVDEHARWELSVRNFDHILAAMECGLVSDLIVVARSKPKGCFEGSEYVDAKGRKHRILSSPSLEKLCATDEALRRVRDAEVLLLDFDLDCFTTLSDADPLTILPWPRPVIRDFLLSEETKPFWDAVLPKAAAITLAREPFHIGGLAAEAALYRDFAEVLFRDLLGAEPP